MRQAGKLGLNQDTIGRCRVLARRVADGLMPEIRARSTDSCERAILRFWGVEGSVPGSDVPLVNAVVDSLKREGRIQDGVAAPVAALIAATGIEAGEVCVRLVAGSLAWPSPESCVSSAVHAQAERLTEAGFERIRAAAASRSIRAARSPSAPPTPSCRRSSSRRAASSLG